MAGRIEYETPILKLSYLKGSTDMPASALPFRP